MTTFEQLSALVDIEISLIKSVRRIKLLNRPPSNLLTDTYQSFNDLKAKSAQIDSYAGDCIIARIDHLFQDDVIQPLLKK
ncbi:hypothetical protein AB4559_18210 [Vibrio sp. 10N.222.51.C8]|jgi:hypothetical protein|uniref:hypothetical protein n=1 Tax=Vibrio TaxID=662 RepID=UPI0010BDACFA|nr:MULTISPECIES: hypothetical protein [Vibrio]CAK2047727.1 conserved hypothetical protein [Vibrio crassostreae]TKG08597.1 hypothetical protein FCV67_08935 [Vibrio sp. F13]CAK2518031.1 conserved hypothetical protein [Vibrio crassostreae]CAK3044329.1 conserved hypothetical protein [Vibrio crassostreae]CAK3586485.1 conserved hypothetical protein [Vibrio crassostreae]